MTWRRPFEPVEPGQVLRRSGAVGTVWRDGEKVGDVVAVEMAPVASTWGDIEAVPYRLGRWGVSFAISRVLRRDPWWARLCGRAVAWLVLVAVVRSSIGGGER